MSSETVEPRVEAPDASGGPALIELVGITKRFGSLVANDDVTFSVRPGEVHALLGENGAGKSTLTRILYGLSQPDDGRILVKGVPVRFGSPKEAMRAGVGMVTQEFSLVGPMTVTDNVMLSGVGVGPVDRRAGRARVVETAGRLGFDVDPDVPVDRLSVGEQQRVEIVKALYHACSVLILDEPTAVLVPQDVDALFSTIRRLGATGIGVVFISHKLREVTRIADRITVLRQGRVVATRPASGLDPNRIASMMIGADTGVDEAPAPETYGGLDLDAFVEPGPVRAANGGPVEGDHVAPEAAPAPDAVLRVDDLVVVTGGRRILDGVTLGVRAGEIVGMAGVSGNGQTELVAVLAGTLPVTSGRVMVGTHDVTVADPIGRLRAGLGRISENRRGSVVPGLSVQQTLVLEDLDRFSRFGFTCRSHVRTHARRLAERFDIRADLDAPVGSLSGGNMQKVLLARALEREPSALVAAQPTRGLDVGACDFVHSQLRDVRARGGGVLLISDDLDELFALADRFVVIYSGRIVGAMTAAEATPDALGLLMIGEGPTDAARPDEPPPVDES